MIILSSKFSIALVSFCLVATAAAAYFELQQPDSDANERIFEPTSSDGPRATGFDAPVTPVTGPRPMLTVLLEFSDLPADVPAAYIQNQNFGPRPSLNDFYMEMSYGNFWFSDLGYWAWVTAWDFPATSDDESTRSYWDTIGIPTYGDGYFHRWGLISLDKAGYDFAPLDLNSDGKIEFGPEVAYQLVDSKVPDKRGGATRGLPAGLTLDGKTVEGRSAGTSEDSPWITLYAHELGHEALFLPDYYGITPDPIVLMNLMGWSAFTNASGGWQYPIGPHHIDPYSKMKLGWLSPSVVTSDGFYDIQDSETHAASYVLHDPAHGTDEYYLVENKWKGTSYDNTDDLIGPLTPPLPPADAAIDIADEGLVIWHVDETRDWDGMTTGGYSKVALEKRGGTFDDAAWNSDDPGYYDWWGGSAPSDSSWNGGADSMIGVWCVSPSGPTMRAWLDVPGPGVMICSDPLTASAVPGTAGIVSVPLRNTGDVSDTFGITVSAPPDLVAIIPAPVTIASKDSATVDVRLTPVRACTTTPGPRIVTITARSISDPSVSSSITATLDVLPFSEPAVALPTGLVDVDPGATAIYTVNIENHGNDVDTFSMSFTGIDFGLTYRADPTVIPTAWVSFSPTGPTAPACGTTTTTLTVSVPIDWAGMEDATYDFTVTVAGSLGPDTDTTAGQLVVHATPESMMLYVRVEIEQLIADVLALPPSGVRDGLYAKANSTLYKFNQAVDSYLLGDDPPASNLFGTCQNKLEAFLHLLDAQRGKALTIAQADYLTEKAQQIIDDIEAIMAAI